MRRARRVCCVARAGAGFALRAVMSSAEPTPEALCVGLGGAEGEGGGHVFQIVSCGPLEFPVAKSHFGLI